MGSLHCAGMCGPLVLALPSSGSTRFSQIAGRLAYNAGRIGIYGLLGAVFGLVGQTLVLAGVQRWLSVGAGIVILAGLAASRRFPLNQPLAKSVAWIKRPFARLILRRSTFSLFLIGGLNGLLPCGLVYVACAASVSAGDVSGGVRYMTVFGLGTLPMMLGIGLAGRHVQLAIRRRFNRLVPACLIVLGCLFILRGMSLGIPYISPDLSPDRVGTIHCH